MRKFRPAIRILKLLAKPPVRGCYPTHGLPGRGCYPEGGVKDRGCFPERGRKRRRGRA